MEEQNGGTPSTPTFTEGQAVDVEGYGAGTISSGPDEAGYYTVSIEDGEPVRVLANELTAQEPAQEPAEEEERPASAVVEPPSVFEALGRDYARSTEDRRETFPILPGRFHGNLAVRVRPVDPAKRKKKIRRLMRRGGLTDEAEAQYAANLIAESAECIMVRVEEGGDYVPAHEVSAELGPEPVVFDQRLGLVVPTLGELLQGNEPPATIVRLLFKNLEALDSFYVELDQWLKEATPAEGDEDDEDGAERPT